MIESPPMVDVSKLVFQQDLAESLAKEFGIDKSKAEDLGSTTCSGVCYWEALNALGIDIEPITDFIYRVYDPNTGVTHPAGVNHINFLKYLGKTYPNFYGLSINPFRKQDPQAFREYGGYYGSKAEELFDDIYHDINNTSSAVKAILANNGYALVSANPGFNGYNGKVLVNGEIKDGTTHLVLIVEHSLEDESFILFDPDKRAFDDLGGKRPINVIPIEEHPGLYRVSAEYLNEKTYRKLPSPGGVTIGLFKG